MVFTYSYLQIFQSPYRFFEDYPKHTNHKWYYPHLHVPYFLVLFKGPDIYPSFHIVLILLCGLPER